jgi:spore maturation protein CgeB
MKMIYVATMAKSPDRDSGWVREFGRLGWEPIAFSSYRPIRGDRVIDKIRRRLNVGSLNRAMQRDFLALVKHESPQWIHFRLPIEFDRRTIEAVRSMGCVVTQYFNDDPFSTRQPWGLNWKFRRALSVYDGHFVYRSHNVAAYSGAGACHVEHCPPTYDPARHHLARNPATRDFIADAAFIGHWEDDVRVPWLEALQDAGFSLVLRGGGWDAAIACTRLARHRPVEHAFGDEYARLYSNALAGICFFSKINRDAWTRRALEIIAVGGLLVCERTDEGLSHFEDRKEAFFFSSAIELIDILHELKADPARREAVRAAGHHRLLQGAHTIGDRAKQIDAFVRATLQARR